MKYQVINSTGNPVKQFDDIKLARSFIQSEENQNKGYAIVYSDEAMREYERLNSEVKS